MGRPEDARRQASLAAAVVAAKPSQLAVVFKFGEGDGLGKV